MELLPTEILEKISSLLYLDDILNLSQAYSGFQWLAPPYSRLRYQHCGLSTFELRLEKKPQRVEIKIVDSYRVKTSRRWDVKVDEPGEMWFEAGDGWLEAWMEQGLYLKGQVGSFGSEMDIEVTVIFK